MITMQNVRKTYGNFIFEMSMELPDGQILGLVGKMCRKSMRSS